MATSKIVSKNGKSFDTTIPYMILTVFVIFVAVPQLLVFKSNAVAETKPYESFEVFYPYYISQHQDPICRRLHVVGTSIILLIALFEPLVVPSLIMAGMVGYSALLATRDLDHGFIEMSLMLFTFQFFMRRLTGNWMKGLAVPVIAYSFAWMGHFYFEHNKPATFVYPLYSLFGDFRMFFEVLARVREF